MADQPSEEEVRKWHRRFAVECNNRAWRLSEEETRSPAADTEMLNAAHAAALHWGKVGTEIHAARADRLLGHVYALLGHGALAMLCAPFGRDAIANRGTFFVVLRHGVAGCAAVEAFVAWLRSEVRRDGELTLASPRVANRSPGRRAQASGDRTRTGRP